MFWADPGAGLVVDNPFREPDSNMVREIHHVIFRMVPNTLGRVEGTY